MLPSNHRPTTQFLVSVGEVDRLQLGFAARGAKRRYTYGYESRARKTPLSDAGRPIEGHSVIGLNWVPFCRRQLTKEEARRLSSASALEDYDRQSRSRSLQNISEIKRSNQAFVKISASWKSLLFFFLLLLLLPVVLLLFRLLLLLLNPSTSSCIQARNCDGFQRIQNQRLVGVSVCGCVNFWIYYII